MSFSSPDALHAQSAKIVWEDEFDGLRQARRREIGHEKYAATLELAEQGIFGLLANQNRETDIFQSRLYFESNTRFAVFDVKRAGGPSRTLALSETGHWTFVRQSQLTPYDEIVSRDSAEFAEARALLQSMSRLLSLATSTGKYNQTINSCSGKRTVKLSGGAKSEVKLSLGIAEVLFGADVGLEETREFERGFQTYRMFFGHEETGDFIEIVRSQTCGINNEFPNRHIYDLVMNGQILVTLQPDKYEDRQFSTDTASGRALIRCKSDLVGYRAYLGDVLDVPQKWHEIVAAVTARWKGLEDFSNC
ncbi:hypothetical protein [Aestuariicoccus sp. MJ-SS9]|uniref:hypothetical protein n=1 Tax=Aestuariicoccus sp. MJ-SS9 TaxID=3079855 RepID=UPI00292E0533|nr:hypothetical protein [Aestuariicoccus sp. MJ-SS9]